MSAHGKRIVRVAVEKGLATGMHVLGEERVLYDDWIKGFKMPGEKSRVRGALGKFAAAVGALRNSGTDHGLQSVKEFIRRSDPEFEEEELGIPTFRHLAYLAEARGLVRIDGRLEPAEAYLSTEDLASDGTPLPTGAMWLAFIQKLERRTETEYEKRGLEALYAGVRIDGKEAVLLIDLAKESEILLYVFTSHISRDMRSGQPKSFSLGKYRLNLHHPRVQIASALASSRT